MRWFPLLCLSCVAPSAPAASPSDGVEVIELSHAEVRYTAVVVDLSTPGVRLDLVGQRPRVADFASASTALRHDGRTPVMLTNAGIFEPGFVPTGLHVEDGVEVRPLETRGGVGNFFLTPNGVFSVDADGAQIDASGDWTASPTLRLATQSGPLLVDDGALHPAFSPSHTSRKIRSGVGVRADGTLVFALSEGTVTLWEFATLFRDVLDCPDALYLDGTISALHAPGHPASGRTYSGVLAVSRAGR